MRVYLFNRPAPVDETAVRSTVTVVDDGAPAAEAPTAPDFNQTFTDPDTEGGLTSRQLASHVIPSEKYVPFPTNADEDLFTATNSQVSSSGTAAARFRAGQQGHGTLKVVQGIEPTIVDGQQLGGRYFTGHPRPDAGSGNQMSPSRPTDTDASAAAQYAATMAAQRAAAASMYQAFLSHRLGRTS